MRDCRLAPAAIPQPARRLVWQLYLQAQSQSHVTNYKHCTHNIQPTAYTVITTNTWQIAQIASTTLWALYTLLAVHILKSSHTLDTLHTLHTIHTLPYFTQFIDCTYCTQFIHHTLHSEETLHTLNTLQMPHTLHTNIARSKKAALKTSDQIVNLSGRLLIKHSSQFEFCYNLSTFTTCVLRFRVLSQF